MGLWTGETAVSHYPARFSGRILADEPDYHPAGTIVPLLGLNTNAER